MADQHAGPKQLRRLLDAVISIGGDLELPVVLSTIVETAVALADATYGALGVLDAEGTSLAQFLTFGIDGDARKQIGHPPKGHGILGLLITEPKPLRLPDLAEHPDNFGFPPGHPPMTSFLGVPISIRGEVFGNLYLTDKRNGEVFTDIDEELVIGIAGAAGVAIDNARLHAQVRELDLFDERDRIARDLHDTVIQRLFATGLSLEGAGRLAERPEVVDRISRAVDDLDVTVRQIRSAIFELQGERSSDMSLRREVMGVGDDLSDALAFEPSFRFEGPVDAAVSDALRPQVVAVVREALTNVARHARASGAFVTVDVSGGRLHVLVDDDGAGPGDIRSGGRGLPNMAERARALRGEMHLSPGPGGGSRLVWQVPLKG